MTPYRRRPLDAATCGLLLVVGIALGFVAIYFAAQGWETRRYGGPLQAVPDGRSIDVPPAPKNRPNRPK